jgi:nucleoid-associated protein YgaU
VVELERLGLRVAELSAENDAIRSERDALRTENQRIAAEVAALNDQGVLRGKEAAVLREEWSKERSQLKAELAAVTTILAAAESNVAQLRQASGTAATAEQSDALRTENAQLSSRVAELVKENENLQRELARLTGENVALVADLQNVVASGNRSALPDDQIELRAEVQRLTARLAEAEAQRSPLQSLVEQVPAASAGTAATAMVPAESVASSEESDARIRELTALAERLNRENLSMQDRLIRAEAQSAERREPPSRPRVAANQSPGAVGVRSPSTPELPAIQMPASTASTNSGVVTRAPADRPAASAVSAGRRVNPTLSPGLPTAPRPVVAGSSTARLGRARFHTVASGESLTAISVRYYGTSTRWQEIFVANRDLLLGQSALRIGQQLRIP